MTKCYKIEIKTDIGRRLANFHAKAVDAEVAAEAYAKDMGATAYIQPSQYFAGGVEFLEFDRPMTSGVWRSREFGSGQLYEPHCKVVSELIVLDKGQPIPKDTATKCYGKCRMVWKSVYSIKPIGFWALLLGYRLTGNHLADWKYIESKLADKYFVPTLEYIGDEKAVEAERKRVGLPVVHIEDFYKALGIDPPAQIAFTPVFFTLNNIYYIKIPSICHIPAEMKEINESEFEAAKGQLSALSYGDLTIGNI